MEKPAELVFIPSPGIGHLVSTVEIAKLLVSRDDQLLITVLIMKFPSDSLGTDAYIESFTHSSNSKRIKFINLPQVNADNIKGNSGSFMIDFIASQQPHVKDAVTKLAESETRLAGFVIDMFCTSMIDVANEFGVPTYVFFTSGAAALGLMFHLQALRDRDGKYKDCSEFKDSDAELLVPSFVNPLPAAKVIPGRLLGKETTNSFLNMIKRFRGTKGIVVNTFTELESHALHALLSDAEIPPVYPVGPLLNLNSDNNSVGLDEAKHKSEILKWLDDQPPLSVVFLCFGSMGSFGEDQVKEIAQALENVGHRFLWSLRRPPPEGKIGFPSDYDDHRGVLPEGFLDRTVGSGKVIGWAPQNAILAHPSVGGFVSHCGWNSTLESLWHGVPVATWPLDAEQQLNAFELVKELGLAVEIDMSYRNSSPVPVSAQKIERGIREVMELNSDIRKRVREMSVKSKKALMDGGSSYSSLGRFINQIYN